MIKITGGELKNRKLETISNFVRPTSSLKREAFFSIIESYALRNSLNLIKKKWAEQISEIDERSLIRCLALNISDWKC